MMYGMMNGALAGLLATGPMTIVMKGLHSALPFEEKYPLPPREITMEIARTAGVQKEMGETARTGATALAHFGYGMGVGLVYGLLHRDDEPNPVMSGMKYGLAVWAASYVGWLPATGLYPSPASEPPRRTALMIASHLVWGATLGAFLRRR